MEKQYKDFSEFSQDYIYDEVNDKLGEGGFASIYRADDLLRNREVVVKVSKVPKEEKYSLMHEYEIVKSLPIHKNIVYYEACYRFKMAGLGVYDIAIMDYYPLGNLNSFLDKQRISSAQFQSLVEEMLLGIDFLHQNKIIHRDIKPANILIASQKGKYIPKIADFGLGKIKESTEESFTDNSFVGGTLNYAAPEQILGTKVKPNADLWAFGALLYKMCTGNPPFFVSESDTTGRREQLINKILKVELPETIFKVEEPYQTIILKCLVLDTEKRAKSATELIKILKTVRAEKTEIFTEPIVEKPRHAPTPKPQVKKDNGKRVELLPYVMIGITLLALGVFWFYYSKENRNQGSPTMQNSPTEMVKDTIPKNKPESNTVSPVTTQPKEQAVDTVQKETKPLPERSKAKPKKQKDKQEGGSFIYDYELNKPKKKSSGPKDN